MSRQPPFPLPSFALRSPDNRVVVEVRAATIEEAELVHAIMLSAFEEYRGVLDPPSGALTETVENVREEMAKGGALLAFSEGEPAGSARYALMSDHIYFGRLAVLPSMRQRGAARAILCAMDQVAKDLGHSEIRLATREVLGSNLRLYESSGYVVVGRNLHPKGGAMVVDLAKAIWGHGAD